MALTLLSRKMWYVQGRFGRSDTGGKAVADLPEILREARVVDEPGLLRQLALDLAADLDFLLLAHTEERRVGDRRRPGPGKGTDDRDRHHEGEDSNTSDV